MKHYVWKQLKIFTLTSVMSLALLGCKDSDGDKAKGTALEEQQKTSETDEIEAPEEGQPEAREPQNQKEGIDVGKIAGNGGEQGEEEPAGEITELGEGQFTIMKYIQEKGEDGIEILGSPSPEAEADDEFESLTVLCDEHTHIYKRTIRDGGASYEDEESSFGKLEKGMEVNLKGSYEGDAFRAFEIQIVEVVF